MKNKISINIVKQYLMPEDEWEYLSYFPTRFKDYEELVMDALELPESYEERRSRFYALKDIFFDGNTKELCQFIKNNSRIVRTATMSGEMIVSGNTSVELNEGQSAEDVDWNDAVFQGDLEDPDYGDFDAKGDASITQMIVMNDYDTYAKQFVKDAEEVA